MLKNVSLPVPCKVILFASGFYYWINPADIIYIHADGSYTKVIMEDNTSITVSKNMKYVMGILKNFNFFFNVHRSWVVNIHYIKALKIGSNNLEANNFLVMKNEESIPIVAEKRKKLLEIYAIN